MKHLLSVKNPPLGLETVSECALASHGCGFHGNAVGVDGEQGIPLPAECLFLSELQDSVQVPQAQPGDRNLVQVPFLRVFLGAWCGGSQGKMI